MEDYLGELPGGDWSEGRAKRDDVVGGACACQIVVVTIVESSSLWTRNLEALRKRRRHAI